jgi:acyl-CoA thioester hydrolase
MDGYPFTFSLQVRWRDLDALEHVNNATLVSYLETARVEMWRRWRREQGPAIVPFVVARLTVEYRAPIGMHDSVEIGLRVSRIGSTSFDYEYRVEASGRLAAEASTVMVHVDEAGRPKALPEALRARLEELRSP